ncbi:MAG: hypothetical protein AAGF90_16500 [Pseudomonadota bacterium]
MSDTFRLLINVIRVSSIVAALVFAGFYVFVSQDQKGFEASVVGFAKLKISDEVERRFPLLGGDVAEGVRKFGDELGAEQARLGRIHDGRAPEIVGAVLAQLCECEANRAKAATKLAKTLRTSLRAEIDELGDARGRLESFVGGRFEAIVDALRRDLAIFAATNVFAFAAAVGATFVGRERRGLTALPAALLMTAALVGAAVYVLGQDWFHAIVYDDYMGGAYVLFMAFVSALLMDIFVNRGRVCRLLSGVLSIPIPVSVC